MKIHGQLNYQTAQHIFFHNIIVWNKTQKNSCINHAYIQNLSCIVRTATIQHKRRKKGGIKYVEGQNSSIILEVRRKKG